MNGGMEEWRNGCLQLLTDEWVTRMGVVMGNANGCRYGVDIVIGYMGMYPIPTSVSC